MLLLLFGCWCFVVDGETDDGAVVVGDAPMIVVVVVVEEVVADVQVLIGMDFDENYCVSPVLKGVAMRHYCCLHSEVVVSPAYNNQLYVVRNSYWMVLYIFR